MMRETSHKPLVRGAVTNMLYTVHQRVSCRDGAVPLPASFRIPRVSIIRRLSILVWRSWSSRISSVSLDTGNSRTSSSSSCTRRTPSSTRLSFCASTGLGVGPERSGSDNLLPNRRAKGLSGARFCASAAPTRSGSTSDGRRLSLRIRGDPFD